jgi:hypothetical protein
MNVEHLYVVPGQPRQPHPAEGRRQHRPEDTLILTELNPAAVVDHLDGENVPVFMTTVGNMRESCPKCQHTHLKLVLRQDCVRVEHLFCPACASCFDAHYADGVSALTI